MSLEFENKGKKLGNTYNQYNCAFIKTEDIDVYQDKKHSLFG